MIWRAPRYQAEVSVNSSEIAPARALLRPLSSWFVLLAVVVVAAVAWPLTQWLYTIAGDDPTRKIDAVRTGLSVAAGTGGVFALLLAFRRQRASELIAEQTRLATELDHHQRERKALQEERDAIARRVVDQYAKAAEQLGSDKAPVRLAGLYALDRIGRANDSERQSVIDLVCSYLRVPYSRPDPVGTGAPKEEIAEFEESLEELEVRQAAQEVLRKRTWRIADQEDDPDGFNWPNLTLNLANAHLVDFDMVGCRARRVIARYAQFSGHTKLDMARVDEVADFSYASFSGRVSFNSAHINTLLMRETVFLGRTQMNELWVEGIAEFGSNTFNAGLELTAYVQWESKALMYSTWPEGCSSKRITDKTCVFYSGDAYPTGEDSDDLI